MQISNPWARRAHRNPPNLHIIPNVGSINPIRYVLCPNRNPQNCTFTLTMTGACLHTQQFFSKIMMRLTIFFEGWMSPKLKICCYVFTLSLSQWPEVVFREKWLAPCVNLKQTSSSTDLCGRDLHIFSKSWQHISNKNIHPPNDGIIYPIFLTIFENFDNFAKLDFDAFFKIIFALKVATLRANIFDNFYIIFLTIFI